MTPPSALPAPTWDALGALFTQTVLPYAMRFLLALVLVGVAGVAANWARRAAEIALEKARVEVTLQKFGGNLVRWLILVLAGLGALGALGVETTSFAAVIGGASVAIGLALNDSLANLAAGVLLLVFRPFRVGDVITVAGVTGHVAEIELFVTRIDTTDNRRFIVPNGTVFKANLENVTHHPARRVELIVSVKRDQDQGSVQAALERAAQAAAPRVEDRGVQVLAVGMAANVDWQLAIWVPTEHLAEGRHALILGVKRELDSANLALA